MDFVDEGFVFVYNFACYASTGERWTCGRRYDELVALYGAIQEENRGIPGRGLLAVRGGSIEGASDMQGMADPEAPASSPPEVKSRIPYPLTPHFPRAPG